MFRFYRSTYSTFEFRFPENRIRKRFNRCRRQASDRTKPSSEIGLHGERSTAMRERRCTRTNLHVRSPVNKSNSMDPSWPWPLGLTWLKMVDVAWRDSGYVSAVLHPFHPGWKLIWITDRIAESSRFESNSIKIKGNIGE